MAFASSLPETTELAASALDEDTPRILTRWLVGLRWAVFVLLGAPVYALYFIVAHAGVTGVIYAWRAMTHLAALDRCQQDTLA